MSSALVRLDRLAPDGDADEIIATLAQVAEAAAPEGMTHVARFFRAREAAVVGAAVRALNALMAPLSPTELLARLRHAEGWTPHAPQESLAWLERLEAIAEREGHAELVLGLLASHPSGWVRGDALARLVVRDHVGHLRYLLPRLVDWVPAIATRAERACRRWLDAAHAAVWFEHLPLWLEVQKRASEAGRLLPLDPRPMLAEEAARPALVAALRHVEPRVRFAARRLARPILPRLQLLELGLADPTPATQLQALHETWELDDRELALRLALAALAAARAGRVRATALRRIVSLGADPPADAVRAGLLDENTEVRGMCQALAAGAAGIESLAAYYRSIATHAPLRDARRALAGLAEHGDAGDLELLEALVVSPRPSLRRATLAALATLARRLGVDRRATLLAALADPSAPVGAAARRALVAAGVGAAEVPELARLLGATSAPRHARRSAVALLVRSQSGAALVALCRALEASSPPADEGALAAELRDAIGLLVGDVRLSDADVSAMEALLDAWPRGEPLVRRIRLALWPRLRAP